MTQMKAVRLHAYGGPEKLVYEDAFRPEPADDELLVRVHAIGVNVLDWLLAEGEFEYFPRRFAAVDSRMGHLGSGRSGRTSCAPFSAGRQRLRNGPAA